MPCRTIGPEPALAGVACLLALLSCLAGPASAQMLGGLPVGMNPDSIDFTESELYVLERGTVSVF